MAKTLLWSFVVAVLSLAVSAEAQIGRTLDECIQHYGKVETVSRDGRGYVFGTQIVPEIPATAPDFRYYAPELHYFVMAEFVDSKASKITYMISSTKDKMYVIDAEYLLKHSAPEAVWAEPTKHKEGADVYWNGSVNGVVKYHAHLEGIFSLEITDDDTNAGGVFGAKREIIDGQTVSVMPNRGDSYESTQNAAASIPASSPAKLTIESAEADLSHAWQSLTPQQRDRLSQEERNWVHRRDSLPAEERIKITTERAKYLWSLVSRTFDD
jgi:hypothetical protein